MAISNTGQNGRHANPSPRPRVARKASRRRQCFVVHACCLHPTLRSLSSTNDPPLCRIDLWPPKRDLTADQFQWNMNSGSRLTCLLKLKHNIINKYDIFNQISKFYVPKSVNYIKEKYYFNKFKFMRWLTIYSFYNH